MVKNINSVFIGSKNPTKINAVKKAFASVFKKKHFSFVGVSSPSGVGNQPMSEKETKKGAENRLFYLKNNFDGAFYVSIEGGVDYDDGDMVAFAWVYVFSKNKRGKGKTSLFQIPKEIQTLIENGFELGAADDLVFNRKNSKIKDGAVGILTKGNINRTNYYKNAVIMSLIPFINPKLSF